MKKKPEAPISVSMADTKLMPQSKQTKSRMIDYNFYFS